MGNKIKIHEIAKKLGITSKEVLEKAKSLGISASSHLSGVEDNEAKSIEEFETRRNEIRKEFNDGK